MSSNMEKNWVNRACPCGSWKKYKKCYAVDKYQNTCLKFLKDNERQNIDEIQKFFDEAINEISISIHCLSGENSSTLRAQCILIFAFVETASKIRNDFVINSKEQNDKAIFVTWFDLFAINKNNHKYLQELDWDTLYDLRCSLAHRLWMPRFLNKDKQIMVWNNSSDEFWDQIQDAIKTHWKKLIAFSPQELFLTIIRWSKLMLDKMNLTKGDLEGLKWIQRISNILKKEWATIIRKNDL